MATHTQRPAPEQHWAALMKAPMIETECALLADPDTENDQIVVIYDAQNAPPVITVDADDASALITLRADGTPVAVLSRAGDVPCAEDVLLVARHAT